MVDKIGLARLDGGEVAARDFAHLGHLPEVLPLVGSGEEGFAAFHNVERGTAEVDAVEDLAAHRELLRMEGVHREAVEFGAASESLVGQLHDGDGQTDGRECLAVPERAFRDGRNLVGQFEGRDELTAAEGLFANLVDAGGQVGLAQLHTVLERTRTHLLQRLGQTERGKLPTAVEGIVGQGGERGEVVQLLEVLDGHALEGIAEGGHGGRLGVGELAVLVGIPVGQAYALHRGISDAHGFLHIVLRLYSHDNLLVVVVAVVAAAYALAVAGSQVGQVVQAVALSAPAPVDVVALVLVAVGHEGMAHGGVGAAHVDGSSGGHLGVDDAVPLVVAGHVGVGHEAYRRAVAEVFGKGLVGVARLCPRRGAGIVHLDGGSAVEHEVGHGLLLQVGGRGVGVLHVVPVDGRACGNGVHVYLLGPCVEGGNLGGGLGDRLLAVVVQDLGHGRGHAARHRTAAAVERAGIVVGGTLAPLTRHELVHLRVVGRELHHRGTLLYARNLTGIVVEPLAHVGGQLVVVELALVAVAQHVDGLVVARDDEVAVVLAFVEHEVGLVGRSHLRKLPRSQFLGVGHCREHLVVVLLLHEQHGPLPGLLTVNRLCTACEYRQCKRYE